MHFEPYAYLGQPLLQKLLSKDSTETEEISDELLTEFAAKCSRKNIDEYCAIFEQEIGACASHEGVHGLLQVFQLWRDKMGKEGTRKNFMKKLDQFSVFAGRNPLELTTGKYCLLVLLAGKHPILPWKVTKQRESVHHHSNSF